MKARGSSYGGAAGEEFFRQFVAPIQGKGPPPTTVDNALRTARIIEAAVHSAADGRIVSVKSMTVVNGAA